ncbi:NAD(P)-dependent oxidoreductase [Salinibacterium sp. PAMC 21357]|uniref:NAD(P)-dependent oxidoreductase n=1 Tax=Salinibacterium sp. PAMC 21357 TaxID=1112215 RepID=UPI00028A0891|nr:NAD(P)-dependent oxidoreductase [Salinibacterium sp. PAMC 21357]
MTFETNDRTSSVGFIGVGAMGLPMARNVLRDRPVVLYDVDAERMSELANLGAVVASSPEHVARLAATVVVMVATPAQLHAVLFGPGGAASALTAEHTLIITSSVGIGAIKDVETALAGHGVGIIDAPVTGGVARATTGDLTILAGGSPELLERARPVLEAMSGRIAICGDAVGDGQAVKLVNQLLCSVHLAAAAEALAFARALGLDPAAVLDAVETGAAGSFMLSDRGPRMVSVDDPPVLSAVDIFVKDTELVLTAARAAGLDVPFAELTATRFLAARERGWGRRDDATIIELYTTPTPQLEEISS